MNFSDKVGLLNKNYPCSFLYLGSWSENYLIYQSDDLIIITIEIINMMNNTS